MASVRVIGFCGIAGAGKSLLAEHLADQAGYERISFSKFLIDEIEEFCWGSESQEKIPATWPDEIRDTLWWLRKFPHSVGKGFLNKKPLSSQVRKLQQWWGTELRRAEDPDYWVKKAETFVSDLLEYVPDAKVTFENVRFPNEYDMIKRLGGKMVRVVSTRPGMEQVDLTHESERYWPTFKVDAELLNNDSKESVCEVMDAVLRKF